MVTNALPHDGALVASESAASHRSRNENPIVATAFGRIALSYFSSIEDARNPWLDVQARGPCTCSQSLRWIEAWHRNVATPRGDELAIIVGED